MMMFNRESLIRLLYSAFIASLITMFALVITSDQTDAVFSILKGMLAGAVIWLLGEVLFTLCERLFSKSIVPGYVVLTFLILLGTMGFGCIMGIRDFLLLAIMSIAAEVFGIGIALFYRHKYIHTLNEKLEKSKRDL